ncbi:hypothetical protein Tco_1019539 [Tanacetum coccineum]|uniref:Uncharacterized protein n=1 Tax=Tanacetum coccineum TaxID=301880 RepID=A0ABQ5FZ43_9ASTR
MHLWILRLIFSKFSMNRLKIDKLTKEYLVGPVYNLLKGTCTSSIELEYNMKECFKVLTDKLDWNNPEGDRYPFDLTKPLLLKGRPGRLTVAVEYFFNNDLEFMKSSDTVKKYTTSITKTKAARYEIVGIEDMIPDKQILQAQSLLYSEILSVVSVKVQKLHGYGHLEEIVVRRADRQRYKFKEGDFIDLHLNDIEDMLFLVVQHKLFQLKGSDIVDFIVALHGTLKTIRDELHHRLLNFLLGYNDDMPRRKWSGVDKRRTGLIVDLIDKQMLERQVMRNLE